MIKLTTEQESFRRAVAKFVDAEVVPVAEAIDARAEFPTKLFRRLGELGYLGLRYPEAYGGADADMVTYCLRRSGAIWSRPSRSPSRTPARTSRTS